MNNQRNFFAALTACALLSACATTEAPVTAAIIKPSPKEVGQATPDEDRHAWCDKRHYDAVAGKRPGGVKTLEQKQADDRVCAALQN